MRFITRKMQWVRNEHAIAAMIVVFQLPHHFQVFFAVDLGNPSCVFQCLTLVLLQLHLLKNSEVKLGSARLGL
jgi:hypothetical protein